MTSYLKAISYKNVSANIQEQVATLLFTEWKDSFAETKIYSRDDLIGNLKRIYACYVIVESASSSLVGVVCVNIDTPLPTFNTNYWICNLYVLPKYRGKHIGTKILAFIEDYLYRKGVSIGNLWCEKDVSNFYRKNQWIMGEGTNPSKPNSCVMLKMLSSTRPGILLEEQDMESDGPILNLLTPNEPNHGLV
jgi:GNAT superfamily N-acetyltransferase